MNLAELTKTQSIPTKKGKNFTAIDAGKFADLFQYELQHPLRDKPVYGKLFIKDHLDLNSMQVSLNRLPAGIAVPFTHKHKANEELYIFIGGKGQIQIDGEIIDVQEGSCIRVAPDGDRSWRNNSESDLYYIVIQGREHSLKGDTFDDGIPGEQPVKW
ncbi:MAG: cupin domain-containing protein [Candidatus Obscuribacterales bacterium]|nr:cupin domain-containing protein [Candidatus Obscuribacterales bacterium]